MFHPAQRDFGTEQGASTPEAGPPVHGLVGAADPADAELPGPIATARHRPTLMAVSGRTGPESGHVCVIGIFLASALSPSTGMRTSRIPFS